MVGYKSIHELSDRKFFAQEPPERRLQLRAASENFSFFPAYFCPVTG
jgi:hypothetical protein